MKKNLNFGFIILIFLAAVTALVIWQRTSHIPDFASVRDQNKPSERLFFDRKGRELDRYRISFNKRRLDWVELDEIPRSTQDALIQIEDKRFFRHHGLDIYALLSLPFDWVRSERLRLRGASTISMQLYGILNKQQGRRSLGKKLEQIIGSWRLERSWTKEQILEAYLNLVPFRGEMEGIAAGAMDLFRKEPHGLTRDESFLLMSLIASPNAGPEKVARKACAVMKHPDCNLTKLAEQSLKRSPSLPPSDHGASQFVRLFGAGENIHTTLDKELQSFAQEAIADLISGLKTQSVHDAAVLVADYKTGDVLAYVGNSSSVSKISEVDGVKALRQAGSTLKPLLYAQAFQKNLITDQSLLLDKPMQIATSSGLYSPQNYDEKFKGPVTAREALSSSLNIPAIRVIDLVGVEPFYQLLQTLGFSLGPVQTYGHSLALGAVDISLWQLVHAYGVLARGGSDWALTIDAQRRPFVTPRNLLSEDATALVSQILSDKDSRSTTFGLDNSLATPYWTANKTGTSKDMRDNWCVGYSKRYVVGVWVGNFDGSPMWNVSGVTGAAPIWRRIMDKLHADEYFPVTQVLTVDKDQDAAQLLKNRSAKSISYPLNDMVLAFDPDIPENHQVLVFESEPKLSADYRWELDGKLLQKDFVELSDLKIGKHTIRLADEKKQILDSVHFEMRGRAL